MDISNLKEKLEMNSCHIHKQQPSTTILENGSLHIKTCCILFKHQLHLLVDEPNEKAVDIFSGSL